MYTTFLPAYHCSWSALFHACGEGHVDVVEWLTEECTANVELKDPEGCTPLWVAAFNNRRNIVQVVCYGDN